MWGPHDVDLAHAAWTLLQCVCHSCCSCGTGSPGGSEQPDGLLRNAAACGGGMQAGSCGPRCPCVDWTDGGAAAGAAGAEAAALLCKQLAAGAVALEGVGSVEALLQAARHEGVERGTGGRGHRRMQLKGAGWGTGGL